MMKVIFKLFFLIAVFNSIIKAQNCIPNAPVTVGFYPPSSSIPCAVNGTYYDVTISYKGHANSIYTAYVDSITNLPAGLTASYPTNALVPGGQWCARITGVPNDQCGQYKVKVYISIPSVFISGEIETLSNNNPSVFFASFGDNNDRIIRLTNSNCQALQSPQTTDFMSLSCNGTSNSVCLPSYISTNGLVGYWPFCGNANDESGNGNNGTVSGASLAADRNGNANSAYSFDGAISKIVIPNTLLSNSFSSYTTSVWIKTSSQTNQVVIHDRGPNGVYPDYFWYKNAMSVNTAWNGGWGQGSHNNNCTNQAVYQQPVWDGTWHHLVGVYDAQTLTIKLFQDGNLVATQPNINSNCYGNISQPTTIGCFSGGGYADAVFFNGSIDDIAIYNRVLTQQEITALYAGTNCVPPVATITPAGATTFCAGDSVTLNANTDTTYSYQWQLNGNNIAGATASSYTANTSGLYSVIISNAANCADTSAVTLVTLNASPLATITPDGATTFCAGGSVVLNANTDSGLTYQWKKNNTAISGATTASYTATTQGSYVVVVTGSNACSATSSVTTVTVNPLPTVSFGSLPSFVNINASPINLSGTPTGGIYAGTGMVGNSFSPSAAGLGNSSVSYSYTNANGCSNSFSQSTIVYDTTGVVCTSYDTVTTYLSVTDTLIINQTITGLVAPNNTNTIRIFPNPANDHVTINYGNYALMSGYSLNITNALGQLVFTTSINLTSSYLDISTWGGNGTYFVNIINPQGANVNTRKIVLQ